jgi:hypothetical protein
MSELPPPPGEPAQQGRTGLGPVAIGFVLFALAAVGWAIVTNANPDLWWVVAIGIPIVGGVLATVGHPPARRVRRFLEGLALVMVFQIALVGLTVGIVLWMCSMAAQGGTG